MSKIDFAPIKILFKLNAARIIKSQSDMEIYAGLDSVNLYRTVPTGKKISKGSIDQRQIV